MIDYLCRPGYQSGGQVSQLVQPGPGRPGYGGPGSGGGAGSVLNLLQQEKRLI